MYCNYKTKKSEAAGASRGARPARGDGTGAGLERNARVKGVRDPAAVQAGGRAAERSDAAARARRIMEPIQIAHIRTHKSVTSGIIWETELEP